MGSRRRNGAAPHWLHGALFPATLLLVSACGGSGVAIPDDQTELAVYVWTEYLPDELIAGFEAEYGVAVTIENYSSNEEALAGVQAAPDAYDIVVPSDYMVTIMREADLLEPIDLDRLDNFDNIRSDFQHPEYDPGSASGARPYLTGERGAKFSVPFQWGTTGILYDSDEIAEPPTSWEALFSGEHAGRVVVLDDPRETLGAALVSLGYSKNDPDPDHLAEAVAVLEGAGILAFDSDAPEDLFLAGEAVIGMVFNGNAYQATSQDDTLRYVLPEDSAGIWFDNMVIPRDAPHPDAALAFIDYVLRPEVSAVLTEEFGYSTPNDEALELLEDSNPDLVADPTVNPGADLISGTVTVKDVGAEGLAAFADAWAQVARDAS